MKFERGKDPKETMKLGRESNPVEIMGMYTSDADFPSSCLAEGFLGRPQMSNPVIREGSANLTHQATTSTLEWISERASGGEWTEVFYVGVFNGHEESLVNGGKFKGFQIWPIKNYMGQYLSYSGEKYFIPNEIREG